MSSTSPACLNMLSSNGPGSSCWVVISDKVYDVTEFLPVRCTEHQADHATQYPFRSTQEGLR